MRITITGKPKTGKTIILAKIAKMLSKSNVNFKIKIHGVDESADTFIGKSNAYLDFVTDRQIILEEIISNE